MSDSTKAWLRDTAERVVWTFLQAFAGALILAGPLSIDTVQAAALAGLAAVVAVVKAIAAGQLGTGNTAQLGATTYSYTAPGPGSAGVSVDKGAASVSTILAIAALVCGILAIVGAGSLPWLAIGVICLAVALLV